MNVSERRLLFELTAGPANFAELSCRSRMGTDFLSFALDSLVSRGFVERDGDSYTLAKGVREHILN